MTNLVEHIKYFRAPLEACLRQEWVLQFIHTVDMIPRRWYTSVELRQGTIEWHELANSFIHTFEFVDDHPSIDATLQVIKTKIFEDIPVAITNFNQCDATIQHWMECYSVRGEPDDDDPLDVNIPKLEGRAQWKDLVFLVTNFLVH